MKRRKDRLNEITNRGDEQDRKRRRIEQEERIKKGERRGKGRLGKERGG